MLNNRSLPVFTIDNKSLLAENREALWEESEIFSIGAGKLSNSHFNVRSTTHTTSVLKGHSSHQKAPAKPNELSAWEETVPHNTVYTNRSQIALVTIVNLED